MRSLHPIYKANDGRRKHHFSPDYWVISLKKKIRLKITGNTSSITIIVKLYFSLKVFNTLVKTNLLILDLYTLEGGYNIAMPEVLTEEVVKGVVARLRAHSPHKRGRMETKL